VARANNFSNGLGSLIKRIRFETGYSGMEAADRFNPHDARVRVAAEARHRRTDYILAITSDYLNTVRGGIDPALASLLHIRVLIVHPATIQEFTWPQA
jgi:hypothetical protein